MNKVIDRRDVSPLAGEVLEERPVCSLFDLAELTGVPVDVLVEYVQVGLIEPVSGHAAREWRFSGVAVARLQRAARLRRDFALAPEALALVLDLLEEMDALRARLRVL